MWIGKNILKHYMCKLQLNNVIFTSLLYLVLKKKYIYMYVHIIPIYVINYKIL